jgi:hypothetical protein
MTEPFLDPNTDDDTDVKPARRTTTGVSRWQKVVGGIGLVVLVWVGSEIYDTISATGPSPGSPGGDHGPGGPGPGQDQPVENQDQEIETENDHDPTQFDHG